ncbi:MAG: excinuclease ABC subunit UvrA [Planctomyces sp.]
MSNDDVIELERVRVNNLQDISLRIRRNAVTVICGVSGSGKSSLAFDTLFAEGQRRYIETFSPEVRQYLDRIERPNADRIDGIPPAIAVRQSAGARQLRGTVGSRTEILDSLRSLFVHVGEVVCPACNVTAESYSAATIWQFLLREFPGCRAMISFPMPVETTGAEETASVAVRAESVVTSLLSRGMTRCLLDDRTFRLEELLTERTEISERFLNAANVRNRSERHTATDVLKLIQDRLQLNHEASQRGTESIEAASHSGDGTVVVYCLPEKESSNPLWRTRRIDDQEWVELHFRSQVSCAFCGTVFSTPKADQLNFNSPVGACSSCGGSGSVSGLMLRKLVPDDRKTLPEDAIAVLADPRFRKFRDEILKSARKLRISTESPIAQLSESEQQSLMDGVPEKGISGLRDLFDELSGSPQVSRNRTILKKWSSRVPCGECHGSRLSGTASAIRIDGHSLPDVAEMELTEFLVWFENAVSQLSEQQLQALLIPIENIRRRIGYLIEFGLSYLTLSRSYETLSDGEAQRVILTGILGSGLVNVLYVLDEPTNALHPSDTRRVIEMVRRLQQQGNTVVIVEHDPQMILAADEVIEIGPGAGEGGGRIVFQGKPSDLVCQEESPTGRFIRVLLQENDVTREITKVPDGRDVDSGNDSKEDHARLTEGTDHWLHLKGVSVNNICDLDVQLPMEKICAVIGPSGSGKSSLIMEALYTAFCRRKGQFCSSDTISTVIELHGAESIDRVVLLDQSQVSRSSRSVPATWIGAFDPIRKLLSETHEAKRRNLSAGAFSFNSSRGGRCPICEGMGSVSLDMQFLADIQAPCEECHGSRFRSDLLEVRYRDRSVSEILQMTADTAFGFFHGQPRIQQPLNALRQAGLGYLRLGQPLTTLSGGETQRLRIAAVLNGSVVADDELVEKTSSRKQTGSERLLFLLDEPSAGLHLKDVDFLMSSLRFLVQTGHSVILIDHDEYLIRHADFVIEMGPGAGRNGGRIVRSAPTNMHG